jgi:hypothetical protein
LRRGKIPDVPYELRECPAEEPEGKPQEIDLLVSEKRRSERALARLQSLCLYGEDAIAEKDYLIECRRLIDKREVNYEKFIRKIDPRIIKDFLKSIVQNFCVKNGRIESVRFKNGMEHRFLCKGDE